MKTGGQPAGKIVRGSLRTPGKSLPPRPRTNSRPRRRSTKYKLGRLRPGRSRRRAGVGRRGEIPVSLDPRGRRHPGANRNHGFPTMPVANGGIPGDSGGQGPAAPDRIMALPGNERKACRLSAQAGIDRKSAMLPFKSTQPGPLSIFSGKVKKIILSSYLLFALAQQAHSRTQRSGAKPGGNTRFSVTGLDGGLVRWPEGSIRPLDKARNPGRCREQASSPDASDG